MSYHKSLNLPANPIIDWSALKSKLPRNVVMSNKNFAGSFSLLDINKHLTTEVLDTLGHAGITVTHLVVFSNGKSRTNDVERMIHSDVKWDREDNSWKSIHCGINWELEGTNLWKWWDMTAYPAVYPTGPMTPENHILHGIHYERRGRSGVHPNARLIEQAYIPGPSLVRTDVPHSTIFGKEGYTPRAGISLRIDETNISSWEDAVELFKPLIKE